MCIIISNKTSIKPRQAKAEPFKYNWENKFIGWENGYEFSQFLGNCYAFLGQELSNIDGMQQLIHQYYLQNGLLSARDASIRIKRFLGL